MNRVKKEADAFVALIVVLVLLLGGLVCSSGLIGNWQETKGIRESVPFYIGSERDEPVFRR